MRRRASAVSSSSEQGWVAGRPSVHAVVGLRRGLSVRGTMSNKPLLLARKERGEALRACSQPGRAAECRDVRHRGPWPDGSSEFVTPCPPSNRGRSRCIAARDAPRTAAEVREAMQLAMRGEGTAGSGPIWHAGAARSASDCSPRTTPHPRSELLHFERRSRRGYDLAVPAWMPWLDPPESCPAASIASVVSSRSGQGAVRS